jgi:predicted nucleic acid-binding protein
MKTLTVTEVADTLELSLGRDSDLELEGQFEELSLRRTARYGCRTYDLVHVASALLLGCDALWSFDTKATHLAQLEGLKPR